MSQFTANFRNSSYTNAAAAVAHAPDSAIRIDPLKLAHLDFGLFRSLCQLGTSKNRICAVLSLSAAEFDYIEQLRMRTQFTV